MADSLEAKRADALIGENEEVGPRFRLLDRTSALQPIQRWVSDGQPEADGDREVLENTQECQGGGGLLG